MLRWKHIAFSNIVNWYVKIFSLRGVPIHIIFAICHLKIMLESVFIVTQQVLFRTIRISWDSFIKIVLALLIVETKIGLSIWRRLVNIFERWLILFSSHSLVKIFSILLVITHIVFALGYMSSVIPLKLHKFMIFVINL